MDGPRDPEPSEETILSAMRRASLHQAAPHGGASLRVLLAHLAIGRRPRASRTVRSRLARLERDGHLARRRVHGVDVWSLTPAGRGRLAAAERAGRPAPLPESPQHLAWRNARAAAAREIGRFAAGLAADLAEAEEMLAALERDRPQHSDAWLALGPRLLVGCRRVGSALHCLREWPEPDDARPDRDEPAPGETPPSPALRSLRAGRRNIALWGDLG